MEDVVRVVLPLERNQPLPGLLAERAALPIDIGTCRDVAVADVGVRLALAQRQEIFTTALTTPGPLRMINSG